VLDAAEQNLLSKDLSGIEAMRSALGKSKQAYNAAVVEAAVDEDEDILEAAEDAEHQATAVCHEARAPLIAGCCMHFQFHSRDPYFA
jgi:hypothetical protein